MSLISLFIVSLPQQHTTACSHSLFCLHLSHDVNTEPFGISSLLFELLLNLGRQLDSTGRWDWKPRAFCWGCWGPWNALRRFLVVSLCCIVCLQILRSLKRVKGVVEAQTILQLESCTVSVCKTRINMCSVTPRQAPETSKPLFSHPAQPTDINDANLKFWSTSVIRHTLCHRPLRFRLWPGTTGNRERASDLIKTPKGSHNWRNGGRCLVLFFWWEHLGPFLRSTICTICTLQTGESLALAAPASSLHSKNLGRKSIWTRRLPPQFPCAQQVKGQKPRSWMVMRSCEFVWKWGISMYIPSIPQLWPFCTEKKYQLSFWTALSP